MTQTLYVINWDEVKKDKNFSMMSLDKIKELKQLRFTSNCSDTEDTNGRYWSFSWIHKYFVPLSKDTSVIAKIKYLDERYKNRVKNDTIQSW